MTVRPRSIRGGTLVDAGRPHRRRTSPFATGGSPPSLAPGTPARRRPRRSTRRAATSCPARSTSTRTTASRASPTRRTSSPATAQCAAGGVTTSFAMPNVQPPPNTAERLDAMLELYERAGDRRLERQRRRDRRPRRSRGWPTRGHRRVQGLHGRRHRPRLPAHARASASTITASCSRSSRRSAETGLPLMVHPHDQALMHHIEQRFWARGERDCRGLRARPTPPTTGSSGTPPSRVLLRLQQATGHAAPPAPHADARASSSSSARPRPRGQRVTAELNPWALFLGNDWADDRAARVVRAVSYYVPEQNTEPLWEALRDGTIDLISTDHAPHTREEKEPGWTDGWKAHTGTPSAQFYVPLFLDAAAAGRLSARARRRARRDRAGPRLRPRPEGPARGRRRRRHRDRRPRRASSRSATTSS